MSSIAIQSLSFSFGSKKVLEKISTTIDPGTLTTIVGPNGVGKSTLLKICAGLLSPSQGTVALGDQKLDSFSRHQLAPIISYLPQQVDFAFPFKVREVIEMGTYHQTPSSTKSKTDDIQSAMEGTGVAHFSNRYFDDLSGGEKKRVLIAQALCQKSRFLLLDEPTAALDPKYAAEIFLLLKQLATHGTSVVAVTHDLTLACRHADVLLGLFEKKLFFQGPPQKVFGHLETLFDHPFFHGQLPNQQLWVSPG